MDDREGPPGQPVPGDRMREICFYSVSQTAIRLLSACSRCGSAVAPADQGTHRRHHETEDRWREAVLRGRCGEQEQVSA